MSDLEQQPETLSADEESYFKTRGGETEAPASTPEPEAPKAEAEPVEDTEEIDDPATSDGDKPRLVPHKAMMSERERRKAAEAQARQERDARIAYEARVNERLRMMQGANQPQQPAQPQVEIPDPEQDPIGFMKVLGQAVGAIAQKDQVSEQQRHQQAQEVEFNRRVNEAFQQDAAKVSAAKPDLNEAITFLARHRAEELKVLSDGAMSDAQISQVLDQEGRNHIISALRQGKSPTEALYRAAMARGYQAKGSDAAQKLNQVAQAQSANRSLSGTGGGGGLTGEMTAAKLADASDEDFAAWIAKNPNGFQRLAGGNR